MTRKESTCLLSIFDAQAPEREAAFTSRELTITNYGKDITINITPAGFLGWINYHSAVRIERDGESPTVSYSDNYDEAVFSILGECVVEIAEIQGPELEKRGFASHAEFAEKFFEMLNVQNVLNNIMGFTREINAKSDDLIADTAEEIKN